MEQDYYFDEEEAQRAVDFIQRYLRHSKGEWAGQRFVLSDWQRDEIIRPLFGWRRADGTRRYRTLYMEVGRKNGKTFLMSAIGLYLLLADGEPGAEVYSCAGDRDQARLCFDMAKAMIEAEPALRKRCRVYRDTIVVPATNSRYKVISADAGTKHGFSAHGILFDELHVQKDRELWDTLVTSVGARRQPLTVAITTAGVYDPESIAWEIHSYALKVRDGTIQDDSFLPVIYAADPEDDYRDPTTWAKANPGLGVSIKEDYLAAQAKKAELEPSYENTFRRLHLSQWPQQVTRWLKIEDWQGCKTELPDLTGRICYGGLDLSTTTDLSAFVLAFPGEQPGEPSYLLPFFWVPERKVRTARDRVPYDLWARQGHIRVTDGDVIDYDTIRAHIGELGQKYRIAEIRFDPHNATQLAHQLAEQDGFIMTQHRQGMMSMNAPSKEFERAIMGRLLAHGGHPVLTWMVGNAVVHTDAAGNIKPDKAKATARIDGVVASIMALGGLMADNDGTSVYEERGVLVL